MSVEGSWVELRAAWVALAAERERAREVWRDAVAERFEREYWAELDALSREVLEEMEALASALRRARSA